MGLGRTESFGIPDTVRDLPMTLPALRAAYAGGARPAAVIAEVFRRMESLRDPGVFLHLAPLESLLAEAEALGAPDPARPLWGVPFAVKDNIDVRGMPTTAACPAFAYEPGTDATVVARLRAAGAIPIGKTNLDQFATGLVGVRTPHPVPRNALDPELVPGGSSSGSAVAVAMGVVPFALGTDTAGSGRVPAALNNIVGLKPSLGALSARGVVPACRTLDCVSVFALTVEDAHAVFRAAAGFDPDDPYSRPVTTAPLGSGPPKPRIGVPDATSLEFFGDDQQAEAFAAQVERMSHLGMRIEPVDFGPFFDAGALLYSGPWVAERHAVVEALLASDPDAIDPVVRGIVAAAPGISATDTFRAFYRLEVLRRAVEPTLAAVDLLCVPSIPRFYTRADLATDPIEPNSRLGTYTTFVNLLGLCGLTVPTAPRADGRPGSVTLLARHGRDGLLAALGADLQREGAPRLGATGWPVPPKPKTLSRAVPGEIEIAVCGAHMSGLPLNHELAGRGGRFLRTEVTTTEYRLYRLAGGPPARPGLVRTGDGGSIAVEVWALPEAEMGGFLAGVPAPLSIGTVRLSDRTEPKGFLVEAAAVQGAEDITRLGDWRRAIAEPVS